jgi:chemotaxis protein MotA
MTVIVGYIIVFAAVLGGFAMAGGSIPSLFQPAEFVVIIGSTLGSFVVGNPLKIMKHIVADTLGIFKAKDKTKQDFLDLLLLLMQLFQVARREGVIALESHVTKPADSPVFRQYPSVLSNHDLGDFICDNLKVFVSSNMQPHEFDALMETDVDARYHHAMVSSLMVNKTAEALPGLGIVAAVLGVIITMGSMNEPPEVLGHLIGAALVGTMVGVLCCYGLIGPLATNLEHRAHEMQSQCNVVRSALIAFAQGQSPGSAVEAGRRAIGGHDRPTFDELDQAARGGGKKPEGG